MEKKMNKSFVLKLVICCIPFILSAIYYNELPDQVAIHFDNAGNPDNYAPKFIAAFGIPALMIVLYLYSWFRNETAPYSKISKQQVSHRLPAVLFHCCFSSHFAMSSMLCYVFILLTILE